MWVAEMDTENFYWRAYGETEEEALKAIERLWNKGSGCQDRERSNWKRLDEYYGISTEECTPSNNTIR